MLACLYHWARPYGNGGGSDAVGGRSLMALTFGFVNSGVVVAKVR